MSEKVWAQCLADMKVELPGSEFKTWILPLQLVKENSDICLLAPNKFIRDTVDRDYLSQIKKLLNQYGLINKELRILIGGSDLEKKTLPLKPPEKSNTFATREKFFPF